MKRSADSWVQNIWYGGSSLRWLLLPFSWIYSAVIACRRHLYAAGLFRSVRVSVPVIIVGNITAGGTGKTPLTIWLALKLSERGYKPGIICRGYRGMVGPNPVEATSDRDPAVVGDEAVMIANRSECPVVVHPDRVAAARLAIQLGANVIVSDDGLQHYRLGRNVEIAVVDGARGFGNGKLLPAGPLREPVSRLGTVDQVLVQHETEGSSNPLHCSAERPPVEFRLAASAVVSLDHAASRNIADFSGTRAHAIAGIGNPERFFRLLEASGIDVIRHALPDHADITPQDLEFDDDLDVLMTEKDAVKCRRIDTSNCWYVAVDVAIADSDSADLMDRIVRQISPDGNQG